MQQRRGITSGICRIPWARYTGAAPGRHCRAHCESLFVVTFASPPSSVVQSSSWAYFIINSEDEYDKLNSFPYIDQIVRLTVNVSTNFV